jgi:quinol monooxygenase YgiN
MNPARRCRLFLLAGAAVVASTLTAATADAQTLILAKENRMATLMKDAAPAAGHLALAVTWEAKEGEGDAVADLLRRMSSSVKSEPGTLLFWAHRSASNDRLFFLYELFADDAAFAAHQETPYFKDLVLAQALPKLARRERTPFVPFGTDGPE